MKTPSAFVRIVTLIAALAAAGASAQDYPSKPVRLVVPYPPGSASDNVARLLVDELRIALNATIVIDNRAGASGLIGTEHVARAPADGYTLIVDASATHSANPWLFKKLPYDPVRSFTHISRLVVLPQLVVVSPQVPASSMQELVKYVRDNPGKFNFAYGTPTSQVAASSIAQIAGMDLVGVPYKGPAEAMLALMRGEASLMVADLATALPHAKAGKLRPLAISTPQRSALLPDVPSLTEAGYPGFDIELWIGLSGPAGLSKDVVERLSAALGKVLSKPELRQRFAGMGMEVAPSSPAEFEQFVQSQLAVWGRRTNASGIEPQ
jgi:tripartite-type tricarboxylate transporter receptor subunit TctC